MPEDILAEFRADIERRLREQILRQQKADPKIGLGPIVDIQIEQERERLVRKADELEREGEDKIADVVRTLADDYLPQLAQKLKRG